ncbi:MAG: T9SS type A sorting domain-containing protein [Chitinophagales bacterium]|nr:T9SS type A sorting domain-containing protein [Chitinophagales bacterium]
MKKQIALFAIFTTLSLFSFSQGTWTKKTDFAGMSRTGACGFSIGAKGYIGTGANAGNYLTDFWAYDTETDSWTQIADLSGPGRQYAVAFAIGERGYVGTGWSTGSNYMKTFWEYDPSTNTWTEKPSLPGTPRALAVAFTIGNNGYIGTGLNENPLSDFWKYDPSTESWTQIADYGGGKRKAAVAFVIGNRGFVGSGYCCGQGQNDFWEYNPVTDEWSEKADMPGALRIYACAFSIGLKGYVGTGNRAYHCCGDFGPALRDFWEFNSQTNTWKQIAPPNAGKRTRAIGITINGRGFFGLGYSTDYENDFHEYVPHDSQKTQEVLNDSTVVFNLYPNPTTGTFTLDLQLDDEETTDAEVQVMNMLGQILSIESGELTVDNGKLKTEIQLGDVADGMYMVKVTVGDKVFTAQIDLQK